MKKICIIFLSLCILGIAVFGLARNGYFGENSQNGGGRVAMNAETILDERDFLRIHIRADSNENAAQAVKYRVRDKVVEYLAPVLAASVSRVDAIEKLRAHLGEISAVASKVLAEAGFSYGATAAVENETFPTRVYDGYTLPSGEYVALILRLGRGEGDNWWCVAYPPLCFVNANVDVQYKSKLMEIIRRYRK